MPKFKKNTSPAMYKKRSGFKMKGSPYPKKVSLAMQKKIKEAKAINLRKTNKLLISQGKSTVGPIKE